MVKDTSHSIRKIYLCFGVIFVIQILLWIIVSYFLSSTSRNAVYGEFLKKEVPHLPLNISYISPNKVLDEIRLAHRIDSIASFQLINLLGRPVYQVRAVCILQNESDHGHELTGINYLVNADSGEVRQPLTKDEAITIAKSQFDGLNEINQVEHLTVVENNHPYYGNPLPAYAVTLTKPARTTVYIASELGAVQIFQNETKRSFDWSWKRDLKETENENFRKRIIISFLLTGLLTIVSGLILFVLNLSLIKKFEAS